MHFKSEKQIAFYFCCYIRDRYVNYLLKKILLCREVAKLHIIFLKEWHITWIIINDFFFLIEIINVKTEAKKLDILRIKY